MGGQGYVGKSKLKSTSGRSVRSKSSHASNRRRLDRHSRKPGRFNEQLETQSRKSGVSRRSKASHHSKAVSQMSKASRHQYQAAAQQAGDSASKREDLIKQIETLDDKSIDKLKEQIGNEQKPEENAPAPHDDVTDKEAEEQKLHDEIDSLYYGDGYSEYTGKSRRSQMTSATYISKLEKELQDEKSELLKQEENLLQAAKEKAEEGKKAA